MGISTLGGGKRNHDTHCTGCSGDLLKFFKKSFYLYICKLLLTQPLCNGILCPTQPNDKAENMLYFVTGRKVLCYDVYQCKCTTQLSGRCALLPAHRAHQGLPQSWWEGFPLQQGGEKKRLYVPLLLPNKSWEFIFTLANYVPKTT